MTISAQRKFVRPEPNDEWADIAARALPDVASADAVAQLQSWNIHVFMRAAGQGGPILPSDVIFVEPPLPR